MIVNWGYGATDQHQAAYAGLGGIWTYTATVAVVVLAPHTVAAFASYAASVGAFASYDSSLSAFGSYDAATDALASEG